MSQNPKEFSAPLTVTKTEKGTWLVANGFRYYPLHSDPIDVPAGFETDFASVPRGLWNIFPPDGPWTQAAVLHDLLYNTRGFHLRTRKECDKIFLEAMAALGVPFWKRQVMYRAVRCFGWAYWDKK